MITFTSCSVSNITRIQMEPMPLEQHISHVLNLILKISSSIHQSNLQTSCKSAEIIIQTGLKFIHLGGIETGRRYPRSLNIAISWYGVLYEHSVHPHYQIPFADTLHSECHRPKGCVPTQLLMHAITKSYKIWCMTSTKTIKLSLMVLNS